MNGSGSLSQALGRPGFDTKTKAGHEQVRGSLNWLSTSVFRLPERCEVRATCPRLAHLLAERVRRVARNRAVRVGASSRGCVVEELLVLVLLPLRELTAFVLLTLPALTVVIVVVAHGFSLC